MTILNHTINGHPAELNVLTRAITYSTEIKIDDLISVCTPPIENNNVRLRGSLLKWIKLGFFIESEEGIISMNPVFNRDQNTSIDDYTDKLPFFARQLILEEQNALPLLPTDFNAPDNSAESADFVRGIAWLLSQNIYGFPVTWKDAEKLQRNQLRQSNIKNDTRWDNLRKWARYLGFATGFESFQIDPTQAVKDYIPYIFGNNDQLTVHDFLDKLYSLLPVLDGGKYRLEIENILDAQHWQSPSEGHLSMSLSLALKRLELDGTLMLTDKADGIKNIRLTGYNFQSGKSFKYIKWNGGVQ